MLERLLEDIIWDTRKGCSLKKLDRQLKSPCIVKLTEACIASPLIPIELKEEALLLQGFTTVKKIICHSMPADRSNKDNVKFSIPYGYTGLVEVLSESGVAVPPLTTIQSIAEAGAAQFLVRAKVTALMDIKDPTSLRFLEKGTVIDIKGTVKVTNKKGETQRYLHCVDSHNSYLYLDFNTKGYFSPLAGPKNISGVHTIASLIKRFRLPLTVRVVSGKIPKQACGEEKPGVLRLIETRKDKTALFLPLCSRQTLIPILVNKDIKVYRPANMKELSRNYLFRQLEESCSSKVEQYLQTVQVIFNKASKQQRDSIDINGLYEQADEIYPYIRRGNLPERIRAQSFHTETTKLRNETYVRSISQPALGDRAEKSSSLVSVHVRQHVVSSPVVETTLQFQSSCDSLTLGKSNILRQFIQQHTSSRESLPSSASIKTSSNEEIYFTLDSDGSKPRSITEILEKPYCHSAVLH